MSKRARGKVGKPDLEHMNPCRFCGHDGAGLQYAIGSPEEIRLGTAQAQVACLNCGTHGPMAVTMDEARRLWNMPLEDHKALKAAERAARYLRAG